VTTAAPTNPAGGAIAAEVDNAIIHVVSDFHFLRQFFTPSGDWMGSPYSGLDLETEGVLNPHDGKIATAQIEVWGQAWVVHWDVSKDLKDVPGADWFRYYLEHPQVTKLIHNAIFEHSHLIHALGWDLRIAPIHDTMAAEYVLAEGSGFTSPSKVKFQMEDIALDACIERRYGVAMDKDKKLRTGFRRKGVTHVVKPTKKLPDYGPTPQQQSSRQLCGWTPLMGPAPSLAAAGISTPDGCCPYRAEVIVGSKGEFWLCSLCAADPAFKRLKKRTAIDWSEYLPCEVTQGDLTDRQIKYAAFDVLWMAKLAQDQIAEFRAHYIQDQTNNYWGIFQMDCLATEVVARMQLKGMPVNSDELWWLNTEWTFEEERLREDIQQLLYIQGDTELINPSEKDKVLARLAQWGVVLPSYEAAELKKLKLENEYLANLVAKILRWKKVQKLESTYTGPFLEKTHPVTGRIHCNFNPFTTGTGRFSSSNPNLQNLPSKGDDGPRIRDCVQARPGYKLVIADFSQIELRLIAEYFNDLKMIEAFLQGKDLHTMMGAAILGIPYEMMLELVAQGDKKAKGARSNAKPANFGLGYGAGVGQLINIAWVQYEIAWDYAEANRIRSLYLELWSGVAQYHKRRADAIQYGSGDWKEYTYDGRCRRIPRHWTDKDGKRKSCYSASLNHRIQGTSGDITKTSLIRLNDEFMRHKYDGGVILQVHDEIVAEVREDQAEYLCDLQKRIMEEEGAKRLRQVPCLVDAKVSDRWNK
jgi:DNA polymerase I-like protein with 3'-5' exonuclease and polymerase domains